MCVHTCVCKHFVQVSMYIQTMFVCVCMYIWMYVYVRTYVRMYVRTYVRMYVCMYVSMYACTYALTGPAKIKHVNANYT